MSDSKDAISDLAAHCIRCGFCLESCPTFIVTGKETESPRGRIYLIRTANDGGMNWGTGVREHIDACVGCRACETACPSGVEYGALLELAREQLEKGSGRFGKRLLLAGITNPRLLKLQLALGALFPGRKVPTVVNRLVSKEKPEADKPVAQKPGDWKDFDESGLMPLKGEVAVLQGCAMDVLFPRVQEATRRLLRRVGYSARMVQGCCGALHAHNGFLSKSRQMASALLKRVPPAQQIVVNSAGCGSHLKEQANGETEVLDLSEFLLANGLEGLLGTSNGVNQKVTYHDACHLAHGQKVRSQPRRLLAAIPGIAIGELKEADMCCGSGGIYNLTQPGLARQLIERKWANIAATSAQIVVTGNPGCHSWIEQRAREAGGEVKVMHTAELLESAFSKET